MKLIIDIPEHILDTIQADEMLSRVQLSILQMHILNGTPLDDVKAEIQDCIANEPMTTGEEIGMRKALNTIEKYIGKESEKKSKWIPVSERLPEELEPVNITWVNHSPESYYADIKDKPFTATGVYFNGKWYWWSTLCTDILAEYGHNHDDVIYDGIEIIAWMPLPKPYMAEKGGE